MRLFRDPFVTSTDAAGVVWRQRTNKQGESIGRKVKVSDPNYVPEGAGLRSAPLDAITAAWCVLTAGGVGYLVYAFIAEVL